MAIAFQIAVKARSSDSKHLRSAQAVSLTQLKHSLDMQLAHLVERQRPPVIALVSLRTAALQVLWQVR